MRFLLTIVVLGLVAIFASAQEPDYDKIADGLIQEVLKNIETHEKGLELVEATKPKYGKQKREERTLPYHDTVRKFFRYESPRQREKHIADIKAFIAKLKAIDRPEEYFAKAPIGTIHEAKVGTIFKILDFSDRREIIKEYDMTVRVIENLDDERALLELLYVEDRTEQPKTTRLNEPEPEIGIPKRRDENHLILKGAPSDYTMWNDTYVLPDLNIIGEEVIKIDKQPKRVLVVAITTQENIDKLRKAIASRLLVGAQPVPPF